MALNPSPDLLSNYQGGISITPSDSANLSVNVRGIYVGAGGTVVLDTIQGDTLTFINLPDAYLLPLCTRRVRATGTTATDLVGVV